MENGIKALYMATGVLLGVLLLSIMVYMFRAGGSVNQQYDEEQINNQLVLYNSKFEYYNVENNTIMDMISVANLAYNINSDNNYDSNTAVQIEILIGNKTFKIPNTRPENDLGRNEILDENNKISIYDLTTKTIGQLGITGSNFGQDDRLTTTKYDITTNKTIYKYLFSCKPEEIKYDSVTGKLNYMKFYGYFNSEDLDDEH